MDDWLLQDAELVELEPRDFLGAEAATAENQRNQTSKDYEQ